MGVGGQRHALAALPPGMNLYPLYSSLNGSQGRPRPPLPLPATNGITPTIIQHLKTPETVDPQTPAPVHEVTDSSKKPSNLPVKSSTYNITK